jgi:hypothetical protein
MVEPVMSAASAPRGERDPVWLLEESLEAHEREAV